MTIYKMIKKKYPFAHVATDMEHLKQMVMDGKVHVDIDDTLVRDFVERCLTANETDRIDIDEIERHPIL